MTQDHVSVFETTLQKTNELLNMMCDRFGWTDKHRSYGALRGVLHALRDRLPIESAVAFGAQLTMLIRGFYYEGWKPSAVPLKMKRDEFLAEVEEAIVLPVTQTTEEIVAGTIQMLATHIDPAELVKIKKVLPKDIVSLFGD